MKFMKLGSKPDAFQADGNTVRYLSSELATDVIIIVGGVKFYLHKESINTQMAEETAPYKESGRQSCQLVRWMENKECKRKELENLMTTADSNLIKGHKNETTNVKLGGNVWKQDSTEESNVPYSLPRRSFCHRKHNSVIDDSSFPGSPVFPTYMATTESAKAKFPLLSKSNHLQKLVAKASEENSDEIRLVDFPGGPKAFEICAKFCYGMIVTLNAYNVVAARCAAEYLEMNEDVDRGNLIFKIEVFLNSSVFRSWKDSIIVLQTTKSLLPWSEDLKVIGRCIDSIASKTSVDPANINWSYTYNRKLAVPDKIIEDGMKLQERIESVPKDWWVEDICELEIDLYKRVMAAVKSKGRMDASVIGEALKTYAVRWLPDSLDALVSDDHTRRNKSLVETIICLLPAGKGVGCSCSFLLKLLKVAILVGADDSQREELVKRISLKLDEASVNDLLIRARSPQTTVYDVELVQSIVNRFVLHEKRCQDLDIAEKNEKGSSDFILGHGPLLKVGKLMDGYVAEIAHDPNLTLSSFIDLLQSMPESARPIHDGLYMAIDIYLKAHPNLTKAERKKLCGLMDVKKLTMDASMHAAQNDRLPLRVVVQVLFFEQVRAASGAQAPNSIPLNASQAMTHTDKEWEKPAIVVRGPESCKSLRRQMNQMKIKEEEFRRNGKLSKRGSKNSRSGVQLLPSRSRRMFDKLWAVGSKKHGENRSSETSGSSQSPTSVAPGETKSSGSSSRQRRHSIS